MGFSDFIEKEWNACSRGSCNIAVIICADSFFLRLLNIDLTKNNGIKNIVPGVSAFLSNVIRALIIIIACTSILLNSLVCVVLGRYFSSSDQKCAPSLLTWMIVCGSFGLAFNILIILFVILKITCCAQNDGSIFSGLYKMTIGTASFAGCITILYGISWIGDLKESARCLPGLTYYAIATYSIICFVGFLLVSYGAVVYCRYRCKGQQDQQTYHGTPQTNPRFPDGPVSIISNNHTEV